jgi:prolyl oligopeptidase PreP (S9A serine peptidase family)
MMHQQGAQNSDWVYVKDVVFEPEGDAHDVRLLRLNTVTGRTESIRRPGHTYSWLLDNKGQPRLAFTVSKNIASIHVRPEDSEEWRKLVSFDFYHGGANAFDPLAFGPEGTLYVSSNRAGNYAAVHTFDFATCEVSPTPLIQLGEYDFEGHLIMRGNRILGVRYLRETSGTHWFDAGMQKVQEKVDTLLPHTVNLIDVPSRPETPYMLVKAYSDVQPAFYLVYNQETQGLTRLADSYPAIKPEQMGVQQNVRYKARDGLQIPATLTLPRNGVKDKHPMVVLVHGGPYLRGSQWGWDPEVQFLASRGYAVLEPEFRGSTGFGNKHFRAGWKQWGLKMQDDIADGAKWAIASGHADPKRICIAGASYGGYATLMGLVNDPDLYQCGVNWVGVTDIKLLYTGHWMFTSDLSERWKQYAMPDLVGDLEKDAAQLKATSPLEQATRIKRPLLLAYGAVDQRVPLVHGTKFRDAVQAVNKDVEWIEYPEEGHGWRLPKNRIDFWTRVEKFLNRHIGPQQ